MIKYKIRFLSVFTACAGLFCMPVRAARLAIIATDTDAGTQSVSDLLGLELGKHAGVEMVERSELDRVLREQNLAAGSLARSGERMSLGRILKADALVLLRQGRARDGAPQQLDARLVETDTGYLLGRWTLPLGQGALGDAAAALAGEIGNGLRKLGLGRADRILVSVACVFNSTMCDEYFWIENEMPGMLESGLMTAPRVVALERRDLNNLLTERQVAQWEGGELEGAAVILNGDVRLKVGEKLAAKPEERVVEFVLRVRGNDLKEIDWVIEIGQLKELDEMVARAVAKVSGMLGEIGAELGWDISQADTKVESGMFLELAKRGGWTWAAEAAHALDVQDRAAAQELIRRLSTDACKGAPKNKDPFDLSEIKERAQKLARAAELCNALKIIPSQTISLFPLLDAQRFLNDPRTRLDDEIIEILRPARQMFRSNAEVLYGASSKALNMASWAIEDQDEFILYMADMIKRTLTTKNMSYGKRMVELSKIILMLEQYHSPPQTGYVIVKAGSDIRSNYGDKPDYFRHYDFSPLTEPLLLEVADECPPEASMTAYKVLCFLTRDAERKKEYARKGLEASIYTFSDLEFVNQTTFQHLQMINDMLCIVPEMRPSMSEAIGRQFLNMLREHGFDSAGRALPLYNQTQPCGTSQWLHYSKIRDYLNLMSREGRRYFLANAMDLAKENPPKEDVGRKLLQAFVQCGEEIGVLSDPECETWEILSFDSPQWMSVAGDFIFCPQNLFVDNNVLWAVLSSDNYDIGLLKMDLEIGKVLSFQEGKTKEFQNINCIYPWGDSFCVGMRGLGIFIFPANPKSKTSDLKDVYTLDKKSGLEIEKFVGFAPINDDLYIAEPRKLLKWNRRDKATVVVAAISEQADASMPLYDSGEICSIMPAGDNRYLHVFCQQKKWRMDTVNQKWEIDTDEKAASQQGSNVSAFEDVLGRPTPHRALFAVKCSQGVIWIEVADHSMKDLPYPYNRRRILISSRKSDREKMFSWVKPDTWILTRGQAADRQELETRFLDAAKWGHAKELEVLLAGGVDVNTRDPGCQLDHWERIFHLSFRSSQTEKIEEGETALINAIMYGHTNVAFRLIEKGADISLANKKGATPLYAAALRGNSPVLRKLVEMGADVNVVRPNGTTPLVAASTCGNFETLKFLLDKGARLPGPRGDTSELLIYAAANPDSRIFEFLLKTASNVNFRDEKGNTPLFVAIAHGFTEYARILLAAGADKNVRDNNGYDLLGCAAANGRAECVKLCLELGMDINRPNGEYMWTPLMLAAFYGHHNVMRCLIGHGADIDFSNHKKQRAICFAHNSKANREPCVRALLEAGADITTPCGTGAPIERVGIREVLFWHRDLFEKYAKNRR